MSGIENNKSDKNRETKYGMPIFARDMSVKKGRRKKSRAVTVDSYMMPSDDGAFNLASNKRSGTKTKGKMNYGGIVKYCVYAIVMYLLALAKTGGGVSPFTLGLLMALLYCKQNPIALSVGYVFAIMVAMPQLSTLIIAMIAPLVVMSVSFIHKMLSRPLRMIHISFYALIVQLPTILLSAPRGTEAIVAAIATLILSQIFTYTSCNCAYAAIVRGVKYKFAADELVGGLILLSAIGTGLFAINIYGFQPFYMIATVLVMMVISTGRIEAALITALMLGLGAGVITSNIMMSGGLVLAACGGLIFIKTNRYLAIVSYMLTDMLGGLYFNAYGAYGYLHIIAVAAGLLVFALVPRSGIDKVKAAFGQSDGGINLRSVLSRSRRELNNRLNYMSVIFAEMGDILLGDKAANVSISAAAQAISREISSEYCYRCPNVTSCVKALGGDTAAVICDLVIVAEQVGQVTASQITPFLSSRCPRVVGLLNAVNAKVASYRVKLSRDREISNGKVLMAEQMHAIAAMFSSLAAEVKRPLTFDGEREKELIALLGYKSIVCTDVMITASSNDVAIVLTVREEDSTKPQVLEIATKVVRCNMMVVDITPSENKGYVTMRLADDPPYDLSIGLATITMTGSQACGDTYCLSGLSGGRFIVALCDGMGSGESAHYNSSATIGMIESFYKAGFDNNAILNMINKLLSTYNNDNFTCLDMGIFDLKKGICDYIKLGGVDGYIKRGTEIIRVESGALPLGIVEEATPRCERKLILHGDIIVYISDGIMDSLGEAGLAHMLLNDKGNDMQKLADSILLAASRNGAADDSTIICVAVVDKRKAVDRRVAM